MGVMASKRSLVVFCVWLWAGAGTCDRLPGRVQWVVPMRFCVEWGADCCAGATSAGQDKDSGWPVVHTLPSLRCSEGPHAAHIISQLAPGSGEKALL